MPSFEQQFYLEDPSPWQVVKRDVRLLWLLASYALLWLTRGAQVRRAYRRAQLTGKPLELDSVIEN